MNKQQLGNSDLQITPIRFGAWATGGTGYEYAWGHQDDQASIEAINRARSLCKCVGDRYHDCQKSA